MFRVYKPKNLYKIRAVQVTAENVGEIATNLMGRVVLSEESVPRGETPPPIGVDVPTFEGVKRFNIGQWVIRSEDNSLTVMNHEDFDKTYEVARNTAGSSN